MTNPVVDLRQRKQDCTIPLLLAAFVVGGSLFLFWPLLFQNQQLAYRDASYLYYPLFQYIQSQWEQGIIPLWNPHCQYGQPLLADGTASVYYPGKLIFFLGLPLTTRFGLYVAIHFWICAAGVYCLARWISLSQAASAIATLAFTFGAPLLTQANNVVYLVGGAWLPWALLFLWQLRDGHSSRARPALSLGFCVAMMILGGDAQMAYHTGMIGGVVFIYELLNRTRFCTPSARFIHATKFLMWFTVALVWAWALAAIQILPSQEVVQSSFRTKFDSPRNLYEIPEYLSRERGSDRQEAFHGLLREPKTRDSVTASFSHANDAYLFSQHPLTMIETVVPNLAGREYPINQRWLNQEESLSGQNWYASLYLGSFVCLLAAWGAFTRQRVQRRTNQRILITTVLLFGIGSWGIYGPGLFWESQQGSFVGPQVGGVYWLLNTLLPKYILFRYPAKLFLVCSLAICLLAAMGFDQAQKKWLRRGFNGLCCVFLAGLVLCLGASWILSNQILGVFDGYSSDTFLGPFHSPGALRDIQFGLIQSLIMVGGGVGYLQITKRIGRRRSQWICTLLAVLFVDLLLANSWTVPAIPIDRVAAADQDRTAEIEVRRHRLINDVDKRWAHERSSDRLKEIAQFRLQHLYPKMHLPSGKHVLNSFSSIESADVAVLQAMTDHLMDIDRGSAWFSQKILVMKPLARPSIQQLAERTDQVISHMDADPPVAVIESDRIESTKHPVDTPHDGKVSLLQANSQGLRFELETDRPAFLVIPEKYDKGWKAYVKSAHGQNWLPAPVYRANRVFQAVQIPAGKHQLSLKYQPTSYYRGVWISRFAVGLGLIAFATLLIRDRRKLGHPARNR